MCTGVDAVKRHMDWRASGAVAKKLTKSVLPKQEKGAESFVYTAAINFIRLPLYVFLNKIKPAS